LFAANVVVVVDGRMYLPMTALNRFSRRLLRRYTVAKYVN